MKIYLSLIVSIALLISCKSDNKVQVNELSNVHEIVVQEVLQVGEYTYLRALEKGNEKWLAAPAFSAEVGKTYFYKNGMEMSNFESKKLNKTFETIYFIEGIGTDANMSKVQMDLNTVDLNNVDLSRRSTKPVLEKKEVKINPVEGTVTIAELFKNRTIYKDKIVRIKGKVTKFNPAIMKKNWIHIQDGSEFEGEFDLTVVTNSEAKVGDVIIVEGKVSLNKDFGAGYFYKLILEDAKLVQ